MINRFMPKNRELMYQIRKREEQQKEFKDTAKKANGHLKEKSKDWNESFQTEK